MAEPIDDVLLNRAIDELRVLPPLDDEAVSRIVSAAARSRDAGAADEDVNFEQPRRDRFFRLPAVIGIAAAAAIVGFVAGIQGLGTRGRAGENGQTAARAVVDSAPIRQIAAAATDSRAADLVAVPTQFVFRSRVAHRVTLVGDFNGWDASTTPLVREDGGALWSVTLPLLPGRHVYAFMIDDTLLQTDPTAPETTDPDFGVKASVVIVGKP